MFSWDTAWNIAEYGNSDFFENRWVIKSSGICKIIIGVTLDNKLNLFDMHITEMCKKINNRTNALLRVRKFVDQRKARILCSAYVMSGFYYCNLIWMFCSKSAEKRINRSHKRALSARSSHGEVFLKIGVLFSQLTSFWREFLAPSGLREHLWFHSWKVVLTKNT